MGRRGSKIDDNGMKWHHFLVKKLMVTSFLVKNITFEHFFKIFEKSQKIEQKIKFSKLSNISFAPVKNSKSRFVYFLIFLPIWRYGGKVTYRIPLDFCSSQQMHIKVPSPLVRSRNGAQTFGAQTFFLHYLRERYIFPKKH